jgi:methylenetetrahydrofolate reductase (NADPH)
VIQGGCAVSIPAESENKLSLPEKLENGEFVITAEITPPLSTDVQDLLSRAMPLKGLADAVNVTDGASARAHLDALVSASILQRNGIEPILQVTCRDRNRIALQSELLGAAALGISNLLILGGDDPKAGDQPDAKPVFDLDSTELTRMVARMRDRAELPSGRKIAGSTFFFLGVADAPVEPKQDWVPSGLLKKIEAGAQYAQTQFCMDVDLLQRYLARLRECGVPENFRFLVGVAPLASARSARWIREKLFGSTIPDWIIDRLDGASDARAEGKAICVDVLRQLAEIKGVAGAHIMAPLNEAAIPETIMVFRGAR